MLACLSAHRVSALSLHVQKPNDWAPLPKNSPAYDPDEDLPPANQFASLHVPNASIFQTFQSGFKASPDQQTVTFKFRARFKNLSCRQIQEVDTILLVCEKGSKKELYRTKPVAFRNFKNLNLPHAGALEPYALELNGQTGDFPLPYDLWRTDTYMDMKITKVVGVPEGGDLHDMGNLIEFVANHHTADVEKAILKDPRILHDHDSEGTTTGLLVAAYGTPRMAKFFLAHGGDFHQKSVKGDDAMVYAAMGNNPKMLEFLLHKGFKVEPPDCFPFKRAIALNETRSIDWLMAHGANVNRPDADGWTPIAVAVDWGYLDTIDKLLHAKVNVHCHTKNGFGLMHLAVGNVALMEKVLKAGISVNDPMIRTKQTPLMTAALSQYYSEAKWLLDHGANLNAKDFEGRDVFFYAKQSNTLKTDRFFREAMGDLRKYGGK